MGARFIRWCAPSFLFFLQGEKNLTISLTCNDDALLIRKLKINNKTTQ